MRKGLLVIHLVSISNKSKHFSRRCVEQVQVTIIGLCLIRTNYCCIEAYSHISLISVNHPYFISIR